MAFIFYHQLTSNNKMQIKFLSLATLAVLFAAVSAAPPGYDGGQAGVGQDVGAPGGGAQQGSVPGSGDEAAFNARVQAIQNDPEIKNTLDFLIQQIAGKLNEGAPTS
ncbi:hypothetical protein MUCCIDRAFT_109309 [Mucor lusitanicus CBS 277.49]|uniref:Uncharacterized protein n=2 Tax=Mucor circinelloides f. lusitanicus TaxID=29924 RepID=A0A168MW75_MUCCL|nr:hypothetical protein MUCCIDRAFT_109309 [Mucor lusitanicus CBS 277.49]